MTDHEQRQLMGPVFISLGVAGCLAYIVQYAFGIQAGEDRLDLTSGRNEVLARGVHSLAELLRPVGSIVLSVVVLGAFGTWIAWTVRRIRRARLNPAH